MSKLQTLIFMIVAHSVKISQRGKELSLVLKAAACDTVAITSHLANTDWETAPRNLSWPLKELNKQI